VSDEKVVINPVGTISLSKQGKAHIPTAIKRELGKDIIAYVPDAKTVLLFNPEESADNIIKSLDVIRQDLELRKVPSGHAYRKIVEGSKKE